MQLKTAFTNRSGIEAYICEKAEARHKHSTSLPPFIYPYDLGWRENWSQVWNHGKPVPRGNGLWWPIRTDCNQFTFSLEQVEQKMEKREWLARMEAEGRLVGRMERESMWVRVLKWVPRKMGFFT